MQFKRTAVLFSLLAMALVVGGAFATAQAQWKAVVPQTLFEDKLRIAAFFNGNFGLTGGAGDIGKARYTADGGKTWAQADTSGG